MVIMETKIEYLKEIIEKASEIDATDIVDCAEARLRELQNS